MVVLVDGEGHAAEVDVILVSAGRDHALEVQGGTTLLQFRAGRRG